MGKSADLLLDRSRKVAQAELGATKGPKAKKFYKALSDDNFFHFQGIAARGGIRHVLKTLTKRWAKVLDGKPWAFVHHQHTELMNVDAEWMWNKHKKPRVKRNKASRSSVARLKRRIALQLLNSAHAMARKKVGPLPKAITNHASQKSQTSQERKLGLAPKGTIKELLASTAEADRLKKQEARTAVK